MKEEHDQPREDRNGDDIEDGVHAPAVGSRPSANASKRPSASLLFIVSLGLILGSLTLWVLTLERKAEGQVVAVVNDHEITLSDVAAELRASNMPVNSPDARDAAIRALVDRQLLAGFAEEKELQKTPKFLADMRRSEQIMLANMALEDAAAAVPQPTSEQKMEFVARNQDLFANRQQVALNQVRFVPPNALDESELASIGSIQAAEAALRRKRIPFRRLRVDVDTARVPPGVAKQISGAPLGDVFFMRENGAGVISRVVSRTPGPIPVAEREEMAGALLRQMAISTELQRKLEALRGSASIDYQPGFGPRPSSNR